ncbi:MAG TPA: hypothetical protein VGZ22_22245 [Isosphaeraceae bacterium]|nr:hypothetical protein [Isosphaeraceae bacterium]
MASTITKVLKSPTITGQSCAGSDTVNALAQILAREYDAPIGVIDPDGPVWRVRMGVRAEAFPSAEAVVGAVKATGLLSHGRVMVWRPDTQGPAVWMVLPLVLPEDDVLLAVVGFASGAEGSDTAFWGPSCPDRALRAWGQAMADRLRSEAARIEPSSESTRPEGDHFALFERLTRRLRVSDAPERFQRVAASALRDALGVEAVAWVPRHPREPAVVAGEVAGVAVEAYRTLLPENHDQALRIVNQPTGSRPAGIHRLAVVTADNDVDSGWFVVVNPLDDRAFTVLEIERLKPSLPWSARNDRMPICTPTSRTCSSASSAP